MKPFNRQDPSQLSSQPKRIPSFPPRMQAICTEPELNLWSSLTISTQPSSAEKYSSPCCHFSWHEPLFFLSHASHLNDGWAEFPSRFHFTPLHWIHQCKPPARHLSWSERRQGSSHGQLGLPWYCGGMNSIKKICRLTWSHSTLATDISPWRSASLDPVHLARSRNGSIQFERSSDSNFATIQFRLAPSPARMIWGLWCLQNRSPAPFKSAAAVFRILRSPLLLQ